MKKHLSRLVCALILFQVLGSSALAEEYKGEYDSTNFRLRDSNVSVEGGRSTSTNFEYYSISGLPVIGYSDSTSFAEKVGMLYYKTIAYNQNAFRFYANTNAVQPTTALAVENAQAESSDTARLRIGVAIDGEAIEAGQNVGFVLQYAGLGSSASCSAVTSGSFQDVTLSTETGLFRGYDNTSVSDGATITAALLSTSSALETYEENGQTGTPANDIMVGSNRDGEWDWSLKYHGVDTNVTFCFRLVTAGSRQALDTYTRYPTLKIPASTTTGVALTSSSGSSSGGGGSGGSTSADEETAAEEGTEESTEEEPTAEEAATEEPTALSIDFTGSTAPSSTVSILQDGELVDEVTAGSDGTFSATLTDLTEGLYNFTFYSTDADGEATNLYLLPANVSSERENLIENILLPPTVTTDKTEVTQGEALIISGSGAPSLPVTLILNSDNQDLVLESQTDENGMYAAYLGTDFLEAGTYTITAHFQNSEVSKSVDVTVGAVTTFREEVSQTSDVNSDSRVDLIDFSIMAYWYAKEAPPASVDLNADGTVDLSDFSILSFDWTG